ncbi:hypothetical protein F0344_27590 [Streptomyces finlayi]|uniref:Large membrane protein n=1 Tax=Streptomyces finlayi TaxID=67296 RepID=A0A7G7BR88_9ACTN|nr:hypothetical protein [Streptomyces finlayi]QNE77853.1 hypothetical protein F0344_27590 [Streptomyces finlayi]
MSTERPDNDTSGPRRRRSPFAVASVAAAVLLAGGGGAYWAAAAGNDGAADDSAAAQDGRMPPPLALDSPADSPSEPSRGIAPGEPSPGGDGVVYRASGELPEGPGTAAVHRSKGTVSAADVARLARALELDGTPRAVGTVWKVGSDKDGSGPVLQVNKQAPGTWTFSRYASGGPDQCASPAVCASGTEGDARAGQVAPLEERAAKAAAAPVLKAVGQDEAALDARQVMGSVRVVNADPVIGGLPTYGWATGIQVGADGEVVGGSGQLKGLEKGDSYPVTGAGDALKRLNASAKGGGPTDVGGCATPVPLEGEQSVPPADCVMPRDAAEPVVMTVDKAVFGLAVQYVDGEQALVPSWLFSVRPASGGPAGTVSQVAVDPAHLTKPGPGPTNEPGPKSGDRKITSYSVDGRTLTVTFWGGVCSTYSAHAEESAGEVRVSVTESPGDGKRVCIMIAKELKQTVTLDEPKGDRRIVDAASGATVPRA